MPRIAFLLPAGETRVVELRGDTVTIGRRPDNTVQLVETSVSGHHAELRATAATTTDGGERAWICRDLGSANSTLVNGVAVPPAAGGGIPLRDGDRLTLGRVIGRFDAAQITPADVENLPLGTMINGVYRLLIELGEGPGYVAFRGHDELRDRPVSLRIYRRPSRAAVVPSSADAGLAEIERAARCVQNAATQPNLVSIWDIQPWLDGALVTVSEWLEAVPLLEVLRRRGAFPIPEALALLAQATAASDGAVAALDFNPRPVLIAFWPPPPPLAESLEAARARLSGPLASWPAFALKFSAMFVRELASGESGDPAWEMVPPPEPAQAVTVLAAFFCELIGRPVRAGETGSRSRVIHPGLGEAGNAVLHRALHPRGDTESFASGRAFYEALSRSQGFQ